MAPDPELAELIEFVASKIRRSGVTGRTRRDFHAAWLDLEARNDPADIGQLLDGVVEQGTAVDFVERVAALSRRPTDPRIATAMVRVLREPPLRSVRGRKLYQSVFALLDSQRDRRQLLPLVDLTVGVSDGEGNSEVARIEREFGAEMGWWMREQVERSIRVLKEIGPAPVMSGAMGAALEDLRRELGLADSDTGRATVRQLLDSIRSNPHDDRVRQVYADMLMEQDDPRGEFIALQFRREAGTLTRDQERRERALLRRHWKSWVGDLLPVVDREGIEFRRGFLTRARVMAPNRRVGLRLVGCPDWATVEEIQLRPPSEGHRPFEAILDPALRALRVLRYIATEEELLALFEGSPRPLHTVGINAAMLAMWGVRGRFKNTHRDAISKAPGLPRLRRLELACPAGPGTFTPSVDRLGWIADAPVVERLDSLYIGHGIRYLADWIGVLDEAPLSRLELDGMQWRAVVTRGVEGKLSELYATPRPGVRPQHGELTRALEVVPRGALTRLTLEGEHPDLPAVGLLAERVKGVVVER